MSEPAQPCIRGCRKPCPCEGCRATPEGEQPAHEPIPQPQREGLLCARCAGKLDGWLTDIVDDTLRLDTRKVQGDPMEQQGKHQKISGSPALCRLEVAALTDRRTMRDEDDDPNAPLFVAGVVTSWARLFAEEHEIDSPVDLMAPAVALLRAWWDTLVSELWVDEFYADMQQIRRLLDRAHGITKQRPLWHCLSVFEENGQTVSCGHPIYARIDDPVVRCGRCGRIYQGPDKLRLIVSERFDQGA